MENKPHEEELPEQLLESISNEAEEVTKENAKHRVWAYKFGYKDGYWTGATSYAIWKVKHDKLKEELEKAQGHSYDWYKLQCEIDRLKLKGNTLALAWRRLSRSVAVHPFFYDNSEWVDYISFGDKAHAEWEGEAKVEQPRYRTAWVKVSDKLPEPDQRVMLYNDGLLLAVFKFWPAGFRENDEACFIGMNDKGPYGLDEVTHWAPLPDGPGESPAAGREEADPQELWDEHSSFIGDDIEYLSYWAGRDVMKKEDFFKAIAQLFKQQKNK